MQQKPADKLIGRYSNLLTLVVESTVSVLEGNQTIFDFHDTMVGNGRPTEKPENKPSQGNLS